MDVSEGASLLAWPDVDMVSQYAEAAMQWATGEGIITGAGDKLNPRGNAMRCEAAAMLMRFIEGAK